MNINTVTGTSLQVPFPYEQGNTRGPVCENDEFNRYIFTVPLFYIRINSYDYNNNK